MRLKSLVAALATVFFAAILVLAAGAKGASYPTVAPLNPEFEAIVIEKAQGSYEIPKTASGHSLGYIPPPIDLRYLEPGGTIIAKEMAADLATALPAFWDWRSSPGYNAVTSVKDQGNCGSCWAFANTGAIEARYKISASGHPNYNLSENNMTSLDTYDNLACHWPWLGGRCNGGNTFLATAYAVGLILKSSARQFQKGMLTETNDPYTDSSTYLNPKCNYTSRPYPAFRINGARWIYGDTILMKQAIYKYGPLVSAFFMDNSFMNSGSIYYNPQWLNGTNHEILIVGWDDSIDWPDGSGSGAWIVKNSWGPAWGLNGYFYICYGSGGIGSDSLAYSGVRLFNAQENFYAEDLGGWITNLGWIVGGVPKTTGYGANVFKAAVTGEKLTAVEFFVPFFKMPYTIKIWSTVTHPTSTTVSFATQLGATITGTVQEPGYYEVAVPVPPTLTTGQDYAVEIKFTSTAAGYYWPIPVACPISGTVADTAEQGNALTYSRAADSGAFTRVTPYLPNVRVRTLRPSGLTPFLLLLD
jgi:C1A family cysteine protease